MLVTNYIKLLPKPIKLFLFSFLIALSVGYFTGLNFVRQTDSVTPTGVIENYNGNEGNSGSETMKFKKGIEWQGKGSLLERTRTELGSFG